MVRICKCLKKKFGIEENLDAEVTMSEGHSWNGWLITYKSNGELIECRFVTGGYFEALEHIKECQEYTKEERKRAEEQLKKIEKEGERVTSL